MRDVLTVETLFFGDEVRDPAALVPGLSGAQVGEHELQLAMQLIETLRTDWNPAAYADTYREDLLRILTEKAPTPAALAPPRQPAGGASAVEQLMAALKESVDAAKAKQGKNRRSRSKKAG
jgi:DNA end-binding protein Ku